MFKHRSTAQEIIDNLAFACPTLLDNLHDMEQLNDWLGYNKTLIRGIEKVAKQHKNIQKHQPIVIADLGCGSGDALRSLHNWAIKEQQALDLIGIDGNAAVIDYAKQSSKAYPSIRYQQMDIASLHNDLRSKTPAFDIICLNNVCHHFEDKALIDLLKNLQQQARLAIIINDLHRHWLAYIGILSLAKLLKFTQLTKHDGSLSVLKGFRKKELISLLTLADIHSYEIRWTLGFRWQLIIKNCD